MTTPERHALARTLAHLRADPPDVTAAVAEIERTLAADAHTRAERDDPSGRWGVGGAEPFRGEVPPVSFVTAMED